jgi:hypothetical protein
VTSTEGETDRYNIIKKSVDTILNIHHTGGPLERTERFLHKVACTGNKVAINLF